MAKCENCYHYHTCDLQYRLEDYQECKYYKNKSLIVELPCRASDKVYILIDESEKFGGTYIKEVSTAGRIWTDRCYYDSYDTGGMLFFSREEAEKALEEREEREKNGNEVR